MAKKSSSAEKSDTIDEVKAEDAAKDAPVDDAAKKAEEKKKQEEERKKKLEGQEVKDGDMILVDILGKTVEEDPSRNIVFQASNNEDAKMLLNYDPKKAGQYSPELAIVGKKGFLMDKIDEGIKGMKYFEPKTLVLEPKDAFGERDGKKIEKLNAKQFRKDMGGEEEPRPGATYKDKKGRQGTVLRVGQGRMIVDFNHPLAGKKVEYKVKVVDKIEGFDAQVKAFIERRLPGMGALMDMFKITHDIKSKMLEIELPQAVAFQLGQQQGSVYFKFGVSMDLQEHIPDVENVKFSEVYTKYPAMGAHDHDHDHDHEHEHEEAKVA